MAHTQTSDCGCRRHEDRFRGEAAYIAFKSGWLRSRRSTSLARRKADIQNPNRYALLYACASREFALPEFADEFSPQSNHTLMSAAPPLIEEARATKMEIDYSAPTSATLDQVDEPMSIICHAGPDAAWPELEGFLSAIQSTLTVGMYDFTSGH